MEYINNWQEELSREISLILTILFIFLFLWYETILFSWAIVQRHVNSALSDLEKARSLNKEIVVEKSLLYQKSLKSLRKAIGLNPLDARSYFEYAEVISEIESDSGLASSLDIKSFGGQQEGSIGFYNLAKLKYNQAIFREPTNAIYHQRLGIIYDKLHDTRRTEEEFKKAVLLDPQNLRIHLYLSQYFLLKDKPVGFLYHFDRTVGLYRVLPRSPLSETVEDFFRAINRQDLIK